MAKAMAAEEHRSTPVDLTQLTWDLLADNLDVKRYLQYQETMEKLDHWPMPDNVEKVTVDKNEKKHKAQQKEAKADKEKEEMA